MSVEEYLQTVEEISIKRQYVGGLVHPPQSTTWARDALFEH